MTTHTSTPFGTSSGAGSRTSRAWPVRVVNAVVAAFQTWANRREAAALAHFDDRMLADIGLTRSDLRDAFSQPLWRDPSSILVTRAQDRRRMAKAGAEIIRLPSAPSVVPAPERRIGHNEAA